MSADDSRNAVSHPTTESRLGALQFGFVSFFVVVTAIGLLLATFLTVGRLIGMSTMEIANQGFGRMLYVVPVLMIWIVGLTVATRYRKQHSGTTSFIIVALVGFILSTLLGQMVQMVLFHQMNTGRITAATLSWGFFGLGIFQSLLQSVCWIAILAAIFRQLSKQMAPGKVTAIPKATDER